jgi:hypothetical protein
MSETKIIQAWKRAGNVSRAIQPPASRCKGYMTQVMFKSLVGIDSGGKRWADTPSGTLRALVARGYITIGTAHDVRAILRDYYLSGCPSQLPVGVVTERGRVAIDRRRSLPKRTDSANLARHDRNMEIVREIRVSIDLHAENWPDSPPHDKRYAIRLIMEAERIGAAGQVLRRIRMAARSLASGDGSGNWLYWSDLEHDRCCLVQEWAP